MGHSTWVWALFIFFISATAIATPLKREAISWYDEQGNERKLYKDDYHISLFHSERKIHVEEERVQKLTTLFKKSILVNESPRVSIYKLDRPLYDENIVKHSSPLFAASESGAPEIVLMGGVLVVFRDNITKDQIESFLNNKKLQLIRTIHYSQKTVYYMKSEPGMESLFLANELMQSDLVKSAVPSFGQVHILR